MKPHHEPLQEIITEAEQLKVPLMKIVVQMNRAMSEYEMVYGNQNYYNINKRIEQLGYAFSRMRDGIYFGEWYQ